MPTLFQTLRGHTASVKAVAFFNDGRRIVTGSRDTTLRIWDVEKGTLVGEPLNGHQGGVLSVAISPDDRRIASSGQDTTVIIWDAESRQKVFDPLIKHTGGVHSVCFSPNGKRLASGSQDCMVVVWDAETGAILATLEGYGTKWVFSVAFSPDGQKLASGSSDPTVRVWRTEHTEFLFEINAHEDWIQSVAWSPDGSQLVSASDDKSLKFWDASTGDQVGQPCIGHTGWIYSLAISCDGSFIATASRDKTVRLWSTNTRQQIGQPIQHSDRVLSVAISPNGALIASGGLDRDVFLWSVGDTLKLHNEQEGKEEANMEQQMRFIDLNSNSSSTHSLPDVPATSPETKEGNDRAGDKDEEGVEDVQLLNQEIRDVRVKVLLHDSYKDKSHSPSLEIRERRRRTAVPRSNCNSAPEVSFVQAESDSCSSVAPDATQKDLMKYITKIGNYAISRGGFGEIWKCIYQTDRGPINVAVKSLLVYASDEVGEAMEKKIKRIRHEFNICARLDHPNILPVHGFTSGFGPFLAIVSPWAEKGNLTNYLEHEDANISVVRRFQLLRDITAGLQYLHANNVIHGDLTGPNVLVHRDGTACLADFGLSLMYSEVMSISQASWTSGFHGNFRWLAPELLGEPDDDLPIRPSKRSDIYSFGGIMLQVLTGRIPYYYLSEAAVIGRIGNGVKPSRSRYPALPNEYWHFIEECWSNNTQDRPLTERVVEVIKDEFDSLSNPTASS